MTTGLWLPSLYSPVRTPMLITRNRGKPLERHGHLRCSAVCTAPESRSWVVTFCFVTRVYHKAPGIHVFPWRLGGKYCASCCPFKITFSPGRHEASNISSSSITRRWALWTIPTQWISHPHLSLSSCKVLIKSPTWLSQALWSCFWHSPF